MSARSAGLVGYRPMSRARALGVLPLLLLALTLTGCNGSDGATKASHSPASGTTTAVATPTSTPTGLPTDLPTELPSCVGSQLPTALPTNPTEIPSDLAGCLPTDLPTDIGTSLPTDVPTEPPTEVAGGALDSCAVITPALLTGDLAAGSAGQGLGQPSSYGDPNAKDCYYIGGDVTVVVQATTRADADMPADSNSYEGVPGAQQVPGADRGWVFATSAQGATTAGLILVKGQHGINCSIITSGHTVSLKQLQKLAADALVNL